MSNRTVDQQILEVERNLRDKERSLLRLKVLPQENAPASCSLYYELRNPEILNITNEQSSYQLWSSRL